MKNIKLYICEKLHINNDIKVDEIPEVVINIARLCDVDVKNNDMNNDFNKESLEAIRNWTDENNVIDFTAYGNHSSLLHIGMPNDIVKDFKKVREKFITNMEKKYLRGKKVSFKRIENTNDWYRTMESFGDYLIVFDGRKGISGVWRMFKKEK